ncbi:MAG: type II toxin-antitoxin system HipA family toxin [Gemmatimonadales bacterium]|nr:type II toxin-antitoxin system HipA family toxin [Gemmatimonadales bacterium]
MADPVAAEVRLWDRRVGAVAEESSGRIAFEYDPAFARGGLEISPLHLPLSLKGPVTFPELARIPSFDGLPGLLADALPDRFGNALIARYFALKGQPAAALSPVQKLLYMGTRSMGALEFRPALRVAATPSEREPLEIAELVADARRVVEGRPEVIVPEIMRIGASAGGARPKAIILWNRATDEVRSGFAKPHPGDEHWMIKFDGVGELDAPDPKPTPYNRIEYAYSQMAREAGLDVPETRLLQERRLGHFMTKRFDREGEGKIHLHSLGGMHHVDYDQPGRFSYEQYLRTALGLGLGYPALEEAFRRAAFNLAAVNQDDHVKNFSFLMDEHGAWRLSPAYDLTFSKGAGYTRRHQMTLGGKTEGFVRDDLLALGGAFGLRKDGADIVDRVVAALGSWERYAREAGVPDDRARAIAAEFRGPVLSRDRRPVPPVT